MQKGQKCILTVCIRTGAATKENSSAIILGFRFELRGKIKLQI